MENDVQRLLEILAEILGNISDLDTNASVSLDFDNNICLI